MKHDFVNLDNKPLFDAKDYKDIERNARLSLQLLSNAVYITTCTILHERKLVPDDCFFSFKVYGDVDGYRMNDQPDAKLIQKRFMQVSRGIVTKQLKKFALFVHADDETKPMEAFIWTFAYGNNSEAGLQISGEKQKLVLNYDNMDETCYQFCKMFHSLRQILDSLDPLPYYAIPSFNLAFSKLPDNIDEYLETGPWNDLQLKSVGAVRFPREAAQLSCGSKFDRSDYNPDADNTKKTVETLRLESRRDMESFETTRREEYSTRLSPVSVHEMEDAPETLKESSLICQPPESMDCDQENSVPTVYIASEEKKKKKAMSARKPRQTRQKKGKKIVEEVEEVEEQFEEILQLVEEQSEDDTSLEFITEKPMDCEEDTEKLDEPTEENDISTESQVKEIEDTNEATRKLSSLRIDNREMEQDLDITHVIEDDSEEYRLTIEMEEQSSDQHTEAKGHDEVDNAQVEIVAEEHQERGASPKVVDTPAEREDTETVVEKKEPKKKGKSARRSKVVAEEVQKETEESPMVVDPPTERDDTETVVEKKEPKKKGQSARRSKVVAEEEQKETEESPVIVDPPTERDDTETVVEKKEPKKKGKSARRSKVVAEKEQKEMEESPNVDDPPTERDDTEVQKKEPKKKESARRSKAIQLDDDDDDHVEILKKGKRTKPTTQEVVEVPTVHQTVASRDSPRRSARIKKANILPTAATDTETKKTKPATRKTRKSKASELPQKPAREELSPMKQVETNEPAVVSPRIEKEARQDEEDVVLAMDTENENALVSEKVSNYSRVSYLSCLSPVATNESVIENQDVKKEVDEEVDLTIYTENEEVHRSANCSRVSSISCVSPTGADEPAIVSPRIAKEADQGQEEVMEEEGGLTVDTVNEEVHRSAKYSRVSSLSCVSPKGADEPVVVSQRIEKEADQGQEEVMEEEVGLTVDTVNEEVHRSAKYSRVSSLSYLSPVKATKETKQVSRHRKEDEDVILINTQMKGVNLSAEKSRLSYQSPVSYLKQFSPIGQGSKSQQVSRVVPNISRGSSYYQNDDGGMEEANLSVGSLKPAYPMVRRFSRIKSVLQLTPMGSANVSAEQPMEIEEIITPSSQDVVRHAKKKDEKAKTVQKTGKYARVAAIRKLSSSSDDTLPLEQETEDEEREKVVNEQGSDLIVDVVEDEDARESEPRVVGNISSTNVTQLINQSGNVSKEMVVEHVMDRPDQGEKTSAGFESLESTSQYEDMLLEQSLRMLDIPDEVVDRTATKCVPSRVSSLLRDSQ